MGQDRALHARWPLEELRKPLLRADGASAHPHVGTLLFSLSKTGIMYNINGVIRYRALGYILFLPQLERQAPSLFAASVIPEDGVGPLWVQQNDTQ